MSWTAVTPDESGASSTFAVREGDVLLCFTDGLSANLAPAEMAELVGANANRSAEATARALATAARQRARVLDDVTVVVLCLYM